MLIAFAARGGIMTRVEASIDAPLPDDVVWIDLLRPTPQEDAFVEQTIGASVPTREEMVEIEPSSRLYVEGAGRYMTALLLCAADKATPRLSAVTFILTERALVTVRYDEPKPFEWFAARVCKTRATSPFGLKPEGLLLGLFDAIIDRVADILEHVGDEVDTLSQTIFRRTGASAYRKPYQDLFKQIGAKGDLNSKARESLVTLQRVLLYFTAEIDGRKPPKETLKLVKPMQRDVASLVEHANFPNDKITFLLDAMLGMVGLAQNDIVKLFSVMAVVFMPPTLVASIYGMNFKYMPELEWPHGYPFALLLMLVCAVLPYLIFKWRRWL